MKPFFLPPGFAIVIPAQAGIQCHLPNPLDSRLRGNDSRGTDVAHGVHRLPMARGAMDD